MASVWDEYEGPIGEIPEIPPIPYHDGSYPHRMMFVDGRPYSLDPGEKIIPFNRHPVAMMLPADEMLPGSH